MIGSSEYEEHTKVTNGVTVSKRSGEDGFSFPTFEYRLRSGREKPVTVRVSESLPAELSPTELSFHPDYESENWRVSDGTVAFETTLTPDGDCTTVWGVRTTNPAVIRSILETPFEVEVNPPVTAPATDDAPAATDATATPTGETTDEAAPSEDGADVVTADSAEERHPLSAISGRSTAEEESSKQDTPPLIRRGASEVAPPSATRETQPKSSTESDEVAEAETDEEEEGKNSANGALASQAGTDRATAAEPTGTHERASVDAQLRHLHSKVAELQAYTAALEEFLDGHGTGDQVVERLQSQIDGTNDTLEDVKDRLEAHNEEMNSLFADVGELNEQVTELTATVSANSDDVETIRDDLATLQDDLPDGDLETRFRDVEGEIAEIREWQSKFKQVFE